MKRLRTTIVCIGLAASADVFAQAQIVPGQDGVKTSEKDDLKGWSPFLSLTSTISLTSNSSVVGQVDGVSTLFGLGVTGGADYIDGRHLLRNSLSISEGFARTPIIDEFLKTADAVKLETLYNYFVTKNLGAFGRLKLETSLFPSDDVRAEPTSWVEKNQTDATMPIQLNQNKSRQRLSDAFAPFSINESAGGFADPMREEWLNVSFRAGIGGRHTFAESVLLMADDKATPEIELERLRDVHQLGLEGFAGVSGKTKDSRANYKAGLSILLPFVNNDKDNRSALKLTRLGFEGQVTFNVYTWMGLVYSLNITKDAQLFAKGDEKVQVQNTLLLTFNFTVVKKPEKKKEPSPEQLELDAAKKKVEEAEKRASDAEKKLEETKSQQPTAPSPAPDTMVPAPTTLPPPTPTTTPP
jgi:hypothetical protein